MDFFDVLRQGCTFGGAKRSKAVVFSKGQKDEYELEAEHKTDASPSLDFFGSGASASQPAASGNTTPRATGSPQSLPKRDGGEVPARARRRGKLFSSEVDTATDAHPASSSSGGKVAALSAKASAVQQEEMAALRRRNRIHVSAGAPDPMASFDSMMAGGVPPWLVANLKNLKFSSPTPIQMQCFPAVLAGNHVLASAPTGSGKTIAFLGPLLARLAKPGKEFARVLVVDPTRELAKQTLDEFVKLTVGRKWTSRVLDKLSGDKAQNLKRLDVAIATPLRLAQMLRENRISIDSTKHLVLDEADKLLDLGFAPQIDEILSYCPKDNGKLMQTLMFSATLPQPVIDLAGSILTSPLRVSIGDVNAASTDVEQQLLFITHEDGKLYSFRQLVQEGKVKPPTLIFVQSKERAQELFGELIYDGIFVDVIHADRTKQQRDNTVKAFRTGKIWMLICTDLMARGVDFKGVETVINYDFPQSSATYIHRIGRTGRAGRKGKAITMFTIQDFEALRSIVGVMRQSGCEVPDWMLRLKPRSRKERRQAERRAPQRKRISTVPSWELERAHKKQQMIEHTKSRKKRKLASGEGVGADA